MKYKRILPLLMSGLLVLNALSGCGKHKHAAGDIWERNATEHWRLCECGEKLESGTHQLQNDVCTLCGSEIWDTGDEIHIYNYDEMGSTIHSSSYNTQGELLYDQVFNYEYSANGLILRESVWENGFCIQETEYDENGNVTISRSYEEGIGLSLESRYEYTQNADGLDYQSGAIEYFVALGVTYAYQYSPYGDLISLVKYDADNNVVFTEQYEREYNEEGQKLWEKRYTNSILTFEIVGYTTVTLEDGWMRFPAETVEYYEDGSRLVSVYGDNGEVATEIYILPDETVVRSLRYEYQTDADGNWNYIRVYDGDRQITESRYKTTEEGLTYRTTLIEFRKDGSKRVFHYDENEQLLEEIEYDTNGDRIP